MLEPNYVGCYERLAWRALRQILVSLTLLALTAAPAWALIESSTGNQPVSDPGWPAGAQAVANLKSRVGWWEGPAFGGGEWHFSYRGDNAMFLQALSNFTVIQFPKLEVILHDGLYEDSFLVTNADWTLTVWVATNWNALFSRSNAAFNSRNPNFGKPMPPPRLDVYFGGGKLEWGKLKLPEHLVLRDERNTSLKPDKSSAQNYESDGLHYVSSLSSIPEIRTADGSTIRAGEKAALKILKAHVYSQNNANTVFDIRLDTSDYSRSSGVADPSSSLVLRIGTNWYRCHGSAGKTSGAWNSFWFQANDKAAAEVIARSFSVPCVLRAPPGYKLFPQFIPTKSVCAPSDSITVTFLLQNLDDRVVTFRRGGQQRGPRDNQYGFSGRRSGPDGGYKGEALMDVGDPTNFGGIWTHVELKPGQTFTNEVDLKKWFAFDKPGRYAIHGYYQLDFYQPASPEDAFMPWSESWQDYASADFIIEVK